MRSQNDKSAESSESRNDYTSFKYHMNFQLSTALNLLPTALSCDVMIPDVARPAFFKIRFGLKKSTNALSSRLISAN